jgi:hypothetical protein
MKSVLKFMAGCLCDSVLLDTFTSTVSCRRAVSEGCLLSAAHVYIWEAKLREQIPDYVDLISRYGKS